MKRFKSFVNFVFVMILSSLSLFPLIYLLIGSTHDNAWIFSSSISFQFGSNFFQNLHSLSNRYPLLLIFTNSLLSATLVTIISTFMILIFIFATVFLFKKFSRFLDTVFVVFMFLPTTSHFIGSIYIISELQLRDSFLGIVVPFLINLRIYFYLREEFKMVSQEILESFTIDGASGLQIIQQVFFGIYKQKLIFSMFLLFVTSWNNFIIPLNVISNTELFTLPILIASLADPLNYFIGETFFALVFQTVPLIIAYVYFSKSIETHAEV